MTPFILLSLVAIASSQPLDARIRDLADAAYQEFSGSITLPCDGETLPEDQCAYQKVDAATTYAEALQILELFRIQRIADAAFQVYSGTGCKCLSCTGSGVAARQCAYNQVMSTTSSEAANNILQHLSGSSCQTC
eukprot:TRINITY_DN3451_c0_g1_i5.p1 TRINITY_DN3451_c0_g1~~TRINITY_DN3451_c0_g1_i5.p1  ORF type:complete len:135 (-),score=33.12 TRINITY_DN3451_c0_g1_i5:161-565(-)